MSGNDNKFDRRQFLQGGLIAGGSFLTPTPVERLLNLMTHGFIKKAHAESTGIVGARNYVNVMMIGAPYRYAFDHWIRTNSNDPSIESNPMVSTCYTKSGDRASGVMYSTFEYNKVLVPHMFSHNVVTTANPMKPLKDLLNNMMVIRGYGSGLDGHPFNASAQQTPVGGVSSIGGLAADNSSKTFEAIQWPDRGDFGNFVSVQGKALNKLSGAPLTNLMQGFGAPTNKAGLNVKTRNIAAYELAQARLATYAKSDRTGAAIVKKNLSNAAALMKVGISDIDAYWAPAVARYRNVITQSMRQTGSNLPGISDMNLISQENAYWKLHMARENRAMILNKDFNLRDSLNETSGPENWAEGLALTEYVLTKGLVTSVDLQMGETGNIRLQEAGVASSDLEHLIHDMHESGAAAGLFYTTAFFRGFAAGLLELIDRLKATTINGKDVWSETVVQLMSEFGRSARSDGSGSDHGFNQMITSIYSGAIKNGPFVVGNIRRSGPGGGYQGTQGLAAPIDDYNQKGQPTPTAAASTVAAFLRVPKNPYENLARPLAELNGDVVKINYPTKIVV